MTIREMARLLGREALWTAGNGLIFRVRIDDVRGEMFGRVDVQVEPVAGRGSALVSLDKLTIPDAELER